MDAGALTALVAQVGQHQSDYHDGHGVTAAPDCARIMGELAQPLSKLCQQVLTPAAPEASAVNDLCAFLSILATGQVCVESRATLGYGNVGTVCHVY